MALSVVGGRGKHLCKLLSIFYRRRASWADFGQFLDNEFPQGDHSLSATDPGFIACRHNSGGRNHAALTELVAAEGEGVAPDLPQFRHPCKLFGTFDDTKNPGIVVDDICSRARAFLLECGLEVRVHRGGRRGRELDLPSERPLWLMTSEEQYGSDSQSDFGSVYDDAEVDGFLGPHLSSPIRERRPSGFVSTDALASVDAGDTEPEEWWPTFGPGGNEDIDMLDLDPEGSPLRRGQRQRTTKMRAATLAYLARFHSDPQNLATAFWELVENDSLQVLHLCGCGISKRESVNGNRVTVSGCAERSHLKLGDWLENGAHKSFHQVLEECDPADYQMFVGAFTRTQHGAGLF